MQGGTLLSGSKGLFRHMQLLNTHMATCNGAEGKHPASLACSAHFKGTEAKGHGQMCSNVQQRRSPSNQSRWLMGWKLFLKRGNAWQILKAVKMS